MFHLLCPAECARSIYDIDLEGLRARGVRGLILDLDNTLLAWDREEITPELSAWVERARDLQFQLCLVSNGIPQRVRRVAASLGLPAVTSAVKPRKRPFLQAMRHFGLSAAEVAVVGDQLFTDILGGNRLGLYTVLINPVSRREAKHTRLVRKLERWVLQRLHRQGRLSRQAYEIRTGG